MLEHAEMAHQNSSQEPKIFSRKTVPGDQKIEVALRVFIKVARHCAVQDGRDVGDTAVDTGAGRPEPSAKEKSVAPNKISHTTE